MKILFFAFMTYALHANASTKLVVISDLNGSYGSKTYHPAISKSIGEIAKLAPDLVVSTGDMVAGQQAGLDYSGMWESFHNTVTNPLTKLGIPLAVTPGNHDGSGAVAFKNERDEFISQWKQHTPKLNFIDQSNYPSYYAFQMNGVLFISLDATLIGKLPVKQKIWLKEVLEKNKHFSKKAVFGHLPVFPVAQNRETEYLNDPELVQILQDSKVDLFLSGHHHAYYPGVYRGIRQISQGCLGSGARKLIGETITSSRSITVVEFEDNGNISVEALGGENFDQPIRRESLPEKIEYQDQEMWRDDLA